MPRPFNAGDYFTPEDQFHFDRNFGDEYYAANGQALSAVDVQDHWGMRTVLDEVLFLNQTVDTRHRTDKFEAFEAEMRIKEMIEDAGEGIITYMNRPRTDEQIRWDTHRFLMKLSAETEARKQRRR